MNIIINSWYGRLGNNILQLTNAILIALYYKYNIIIPDHNYFNKTYIIINDKIDINDPKIFGDINLYFRNHIDNIEKSLLDLNHEKAIEILRNCFKFPIINNDFNENDVVIHMRGGDIFGKYPHHNYINPPLSYYINILINKQFNKIYLISEDNKNPCIKNLISKYPKIIHKIQSLDEDIKIILQAPNIITSFGTFIPALLSMSTNIKNIYKPNYDFNNLLLKNVNIYETFLTTYRNMMYPWKNLKKQKIIMLTYKCEFNDVKSKDLKFIEV